MPRLFAFLALFAALSAPLHAAETSAKHAARRISNPADIAAIEQVAKDFQAALAAKDAKRLSTLMHNGDILFTSPPAPEHVQRIRDKMDVNFSGMAPFGYRSFAEFVATAPVPVAERFYNMQITQDGHLAWALFDFDFVEDGKVLNHGVEAWQLLKGADGKWRIFSVVWTSKGEPKS